LKAILVLSVLLIVPTEVTADLYGLPAEISVNVIGCQTHPITSAHVLLLDSMEAENLGEGNYLFSEVYPGEYELFLFAAGCETHSESILVSSSFAHIQLNVMLCGCIDHVSTVAITVTDGSGSTIENTDVSVPALFVHSVTDEYGTAQLEIPVGEWEFNASDASRSGSAVAEIPDIDPGSEPETFELSIIIE